MTEQDIAKLKAAGFTDEDIADYKANEVQTPASANTASMDQSLPEVDVTQKSDTLKNAEAAGVPTTNPGSWTTDAMAAGGWAAEHPVATGLAAAGAYGLASKLPVVGPAVQAVGNAVGSAASKIPVVGPAMEMGRGAIDAAHAYTASRNAQALSQLENQARQYIKMGQQVPEGLQRSLDTLRSRVTGPAVPTGPIATGPVAPSPAAVNAAEQGLSARVRNAAAQRIANLPAMGEMLGGAARMAGRVLGPASLALQTTDLGPQTPQLGRMRGMEINPLTGQRWTPEQIRQYESNPSMFDSQLAQPQFRR